MCLVLWRMESKVQGQSRYVNYPFPLEGINKVLPGPSFFSVCSHNVFVIVQSPSSVLLSRICQII